MTRGDTIESEADIRVTKTAAGNFDNDVVGRRIDQREFRSGKLT